MDSRREFLSLTSLHGWRGDDVMDLEEETAAGPVRVWDPRGTSAHGHRAPMDLTEPMAFTMTRGQYRAQR
jgi:hypothetical protein